MDRHNLPLKSQTVVHHYRFKIRVRVQRTGEAYALVLPLQERCEIAFLKEIREYIYIYME